MSDYKEKDTFDMMDKIDGQDLRDLLDSLEEQQEEELDDITLKSIKNKTYRKIGPIKPHRRFNSKLLNTLAASLLITTILISAIMPEKVWAGLQRALQFIPGLGIVLENDGSQGTAYILPSPIRKELGSDFVQLDAVLVQQNSVLVTLSGGSLIPNPVIDKTDNDELLNGPREKFQLKLLADGKEYDVETYSIGSSSDHWQGNFSFYQTISNTDDIKIVLPKHQNITFNVSLEPAKSYSDYSEMGPTAVNNDISVTAVTVWDGDKLNVTLVSPPLAEGRLYTYVDYHPTNKNLILTDSIGKQFLDLPLAGGFSPPRTEYSFDVSESTSSQFKLSIPSIGIIKEDSASIGIPVLKTGKLDINKTITLGGYPVDIETIERTSEDEIKVKVNTRFDPEALENLKDFSLNLSKIKGVTGYSSQLNEETYAIEYFYIPLKKNANSIKLHFNEPYILKKGPWDLTIAR